MDANNRNRNNTSSNMPNRTNTGNNNNFDNDDLNNGDNDNIFDNPYDEKGYPKNSNKKGSIVEEDPLKAIKRRLKQDF